MTRKRLSDVMQSADEREQLNQAFLNTRPADEYLIVPKGTYCAELKGGDYHISPNGTPGYKLTFALLEFELPERLLWYDIWLSPAALPWARRDLKKLGITDLAMLERPLPRGIVCTLNVVVNKDDLGNEYSKVKSFEVQKSVPQKLDPFSPPLAVSNEGATGAVV